MPGCPACGRPVALSRPTCLYCGARLPPAEAAAAGGSAPASAAGEAKPLSRTLVVLELAGVPAHALVRAGLAPYEAALLARRGGFHLHGVLDPAAATEQAARLGREGVNAVLVPELEARVAPVLVTAGERRAARLVLRGETGTLEVPDTELLLLVTGPIAREHQTRLDRGPRVHRARLEPGWLVHLHLRAGLRPLEIDAANFAPGFAVTGSARLELEAWLAEMAASVPRDDWFRFLPPALAEAAPEARGPLTAASSLRAVRAPRPGRGRTRARDEPPPVLDNVGQFRFYSGWRGAVERRRAGSPTTGAAC